MKRGKSDWGKGSGMGFRWVLLVLMIGGMTGCMSAKVEDYPAAMYARKDLFGLQTESPSEGVVLPPVIGEEVTRLVNEAYPHPTKWTSAEDKGDATKRRLSAGYKLFAQHCMSCHGKAGAGDGGVGLTITPRPRDFRRGVFKWKSTTRAAKPLVEDLMRTIERGIPGTAMQPFPRLPANDIKLIAEYVIYLSKRGDLERRLMIRYAMEGPTATELAKSGETLKEEEVKEYRELLAESFAETQLGIEESWEKASAAVLTPKSEYPNHAVDSAEHQAALERGKGHYLGKEAGCVKCHGPTGAGEANLAAADSLDEWGFTNPPRDLTLGQYRGGGEPVDLFRRAHEGIAGSAMPGVAGTTKLTESDIWDLVTFLRSLPGTKK